MANHTAVEARLALASWLENSRQEIVTAWMVAVRDDPQIPDADHLTLAALQDHFPQLLDELLTGLREPATLLDADSEDIANTHGKARWRQGYRLDEVLRELARIREILLARVREFSIEHGLSALRDDAEEKVRRFFDLIVGCSARQFMREQDAELSLRSHQLEDAYQQLRSATEQLRAIAHSRWLLLHSASHELRNALQAVEFRALDLLELEDSSNRPEIESGLTRNARDLQRVLDRLQQFSNILSGDTKLQVVLVDLEDFLRALDKTHRPAAVRKGLQFQCSFTPTGKTVTTDPEKLRHIADILLSNAIEYTDHGSVEVTTVTDRNDTKRWIFKVADTGSGIHEMDAGTVFQQMHRSQWSPRRGVGMGLIIARHLARLMHGDITFKTKFGEGSEFEVNLPSDLPASAA